MNKADQLEQLNARMEQDQHLPLITKPSDIIPGEGNPDAKIMFIGEAGGYNESLQRKPFVGLAGKLLNKALSNIHINRDGVYITNLVKTRPPSNRDPLPEEIAAYSNYLDQEIEIIKPQVIVTLGRFSMAKFIPGAKISQIHGQPQTIDWQGLKIIVIPMYHPAAALRREDVMKEFLKDFEKIPQILNQSGQK